MRLREQRRILNSKNIMTHHLLMKRGKKVNELFKSAKYPQAVKHYSEAIKRNPTDAKAYSSRAACYTKLGAFPERLKDADKCIEFYPSFAKGYSRKGTIQFFMKEYDKALETYQTGLQYNDGNQGLMDGTSRCIEQINKVTRGDISAEDLKEKTGLSVFFLE
ncbi:unnamed protein product [Sphagnum troendelagicum]|uniref:Uncharacterized protein n=1 Tax=Sphagnum troendelagicum TaxID=128251 RepID=A0ABP0V1I0_9BRYO